MTHLILPAAGRSSRFPGMRPKWLLTMPDGKLMIEKSIELIDLDKFDYLTLTCLRSHLDNFCSREYLIDFFSKNGAKNFKIIELDEPTRSQAETVAKTLEISANLSPFFVKDCDNIFGFDWGGDNEVAVINFEQMELVDAKNKSYVTTDSLGNILNIVEKKVISNTFCCGGYGFSSPKLFLDHFLRFKPNNEIYISHVIYSMLMDGEIFRSTEAHSFSDWGTLSQFQLYQRKSLTIFCDVDGVLLKNGSRFSTVGWKTNPLDANLKFIRNLQDKLDVYLVITSSRPRSEIDYLRSIFDQYGIIVRQYVMDLPHTKRYLINDYAKTNQFPTSIAVNIARDSESLSDMLADLII